MAGAPALPAERLLGLWERAGGLGPVERDLALAEAAGMDPEELRGRPLGRTSAAVLDLRETVLGPDLVATAACPSCASRVEFALDARALRATVAVTDGATAGESGGAAIGEFHGATIGESGGATAGEFHGATLAVGRYLVEWRPVAPGDLAAAATSPDPVAELRRRCLAATGEDRRAVDPATLPPEVLQAAEAAMVAADPLAELLVALACPDCGAGFEADLDVGAFVWAELDARARRLLHEVDVLARAYGWTEPEVLALSEARRAAYLRIVLEGAA